MEDQQCNELMIGGIKVKFPCKPYPSQFAMMSKIIKGLQNGNHCLLESPTGSGKTLALLCSALAWQEDAQNKTNAEEIEGTSNQDCHTDPINDNINNLSKETCSSDQVVVRRKVPKVWFGTRTHKQIAQITHELSRTAYKHINMTILSSREQTCIHPVNQAAKNKNDGCRDLRQGKHTDIPGVSCSFYQNVHRLKTHSNLYSCGLTSAWDLEDFVNLGRRVRACPYFSSRELISTAGIIFCPYNYLIDPAIRHQMNINLNNQIVILDEAHNIEDSSRDAASFTLNETDLINTISDLDHLISDDVKVEHHKPLHLLCTKVGQWMQIRAETLAETSYETWSQIWKGQEFLSCLSEWGITPDTLPILLKCFQEAMSTEDDEDEEENKYPRVLHSASQTVIGGLFHVLDYLFTTDKLYAKDYRVAIIRQAEYGIPPPKRTRDGWISMSKRSTRYYNVNLHFWCLNPAVAFSQLTAAHCVILTSGTLSPMLSFSSELGLSFPIQLEAAHVISDNQVWVGTIGTGPNGQQLQATFQNTNALNFQDELGKLLLEVCSVVPHGVLCFFSSYKMLGKLCERWENTGLWNELSQKKVVFTEPHGMNKSNFQEVIQSYYEFISNDNCGPTSGALLLAVCRGKISEGIDFSDNNARAVITVGIPFPNWKDQQVELKRKYNDEHSKSRGLLTGGDWYETQAFRALNQALGRCIRHKNDWGALVIVDDRFRKNPKKYCKGLSKWVRSKVQNFMTFQSANDSLSSFCQTKKFSLSLEKATFDNKTQSCSNVNESLVDKSVSSNITAALSSDINSSVPRDKDCTWLCEVSQKNKEPNSKKNTKEKKRMSKSKNKISTQQSISKQLKEEKTLSLNAPHLILDNQKLAKDNLCCDDIIVIPSTPEKLDQTIVIPESPAYSEDMDDFKSTGSKRKVEIVNSPKTLSHRLAKKCKQSLNFTESVSTDEKILNESQEFFAPRTRRRSLKATRREERKRFSTIDIDNDCDSVQAPAIHQEKVTCLLCQNNIFLSGSELKTVANPFYYISSAFSANTSLYTLSVDNISAFDRVVSKSEDGLLLDTVWCPIDMHAYQFYRCNSCRTIVAFGIVNSQQYQDLYLFPTKVTTNL